MNSKMWVLHTERHTFFMPIGSVGFRRNGNKFHFFYLNEPDSVFRLARPPGFTLQEDFAKFTGIDMREDTE